MGVKLVHYRSKLYEFLMVPAIICLAAGDEIQAGINAPIKVGNALPMRIIPVGSTVHNVELKPGKGGQIARSAGSYVQIIAREGNYVTLRLRSGEMRKYFPDLASKSSYL